MPANTTLSRWLFWRGEGITQGELCFEFRIDGGDPATECSSLKLSTDCGCSLPQPPYTPDTAKTC